MISSWALWAALMLGAPLATAELYLRIAYPMTPTPASFYPAYIENGRPLSEPRMYASHPDMPFALRPNYNARLINHGISPAPFKIHIDQSGYRSMPGGTSAEGARLCAESTGIGLRCEDMTPKFVEHYRSAGAQSLFLDGVHLTATGNALLSKWLLAEVNKKPGAQHLRAGHIE